uniref:Probable pectate lyase F n=1 Tax=Meloidogyne hapla TaxID=6305 RepID=A0A1I8C0L5_MELHA
MFSLLLNIFIISMFFGSCLCVNLPKWPTATQTIPLEETMPVPKFLDCGYKRYVPNLSNGKWGSKEFMFPVFQLQNGAVIKRCIFSGADGIHCNGTCTVEDCWNENVADDSISLMGSNPNSVYTIQGGGARNGKGKTIQFDGAGKLIVNNFYIHTAGQGIRSCGNCEQQFRNRIIEVNSLIIENLEIGQYVVGVNSNYGDKATLKDIHILGSTANEVFPCKVFEGNNQGKNTKVNDMEDIKGGDGTYCIYEASDIHINS